MNDKHLFWVLGVLLLIPIGFSMVSKETFRYPCQDPANWEKDICKMPLCDVTRTCPEHIFKGQRDPRLGPPKDGVPPSISAVTPTPISPVGACK
jgi:hypothetical protein